MATAAAYSWSRPEPPRTASFVPRAAAFAVDLVLVAGLTWLAWRAADVAGFLPRGGILEAYGFLLVAELPLGLLYFAVAEGAFARTIGKAAMGLRVAAADGSPCTAFQALLRTLLKFLWVTPVGPIFALLDAWLLFTTEMDQRLGDLAAGTIVMDTARAQG